MGTRDLILSHVQTDNSTSSHKNPTLKYDGKERIIIYPVYNATMWTSIKQTDNLQNVGYINDTANYHIFRRIRLANLIGCLNVILGWVI
jgi:hypothetical protein